MTTIKENQEILLKMIKEQEIPLEDLKRMKRNTNISIVELEKHSNFGEFLLSHHYGYRFQLKVVELAILRKEKS